MSLVTQEVYSRFTAALWPLGFCPVQEEVLDSLRLRPDYFFILFLPLLLSLARISSIPAAVNLDVCIFLVGQGAIQWYVYILLGSALMCRRRFFGLRVTMKQAACMFAVSTSPYFLPMTIIPAWPSFLPQLLQVVLVLHVAVASASFAGIWTHRLIEDKRRLQDKGTPLSSLSPNGFSPTHKFTSKTTRHDNSVPQLILLKLPLRLKALFVILQLLLASVVMDSISREFALSPNLDSTSSSSKNAQGQPSERVRIYVDPSSMHSEDGYTNGQNWQNSLLLHTIGSQLLESDDETQSDIDTKPLQHEEKKMGSLFSRARDVVTNIVSGLVFQPAVDHTVEVSSRSGTLTEKEKSKIEPTPKRLKDEAIQSKDGSAKEEVPQNTNAIKNAPSARSRKVAESYSASQNLKNSLLMQTIKTEQNEKPSRHEDKKMVTLFSRVAAAVASIVSDKHGTRTRTSETHPGGSPSGASEHEGSRSYVALKRKVPLAHSHASETSESSTSHHKDPGPNSETQASHHAKSSGGIGTKIPPLLHSESSVPRFREMAVSEKPSLDQTRLTSRAKPGVMGRLGKDPETGKEVYYPKPIQVLNGKIVLTHAKGIHGKNEDRVGEIPTVIGGALSSGHTQGSGGETSLHHSVDDMHVQKLKPNRDVTNLISGKHHDASKYTAYDSAHEALQYTHKDSSISSVIGGASGHTQGSGREASLLHSVDDTRVHNLKQNRDVNNVISGKRHDTDKHTADDSAHGSLQHTREDSSASSKDGTRRHIDSRDEKHAAIVVDAQHHDAHNDATSILERRHHDIRDGMHQDVRQNAVIARVNHVAGNHEERVSPQSHGNHGIIEKSVDVSSHDTTRDPNSRRLPAHLQEDSRQRNDKEGGHPKAHDQGYSEQDVKRIASKAAAEAAAAVVAKFMAHG